MTNRHRICAARARWVPFAVFMAFIAIDEVFRFIAAKGFVSFMDSALYYLYPVKTIVTAGLLFHYRHLYDELRWRDLARLPETAAAAALGMLVFVLWINMAWAMPGAGAPKGFDPTLLPAGWLRGVMTASRIAGAVLVVPLMEELFWRSWLIRYLIDHDFEKVRIGQFTWPSFIFTVVFFGLEHHFVVAGVVAGIFYTLVLYRTRSLAECVLAHAVTNLALAVYVVCTGKWYFW